MSFEEDFEFRRSKKQMKRIFKNKEKISDKSKRKIVPYKRQNNKNYLVDND